MLRALCVLYFSIAMGSRLRAASAADPDMATIESRLLASYVVLTNVSGLDADVRGYLPLITAPGIFADLNYTTGKPTGWGGYDHCLRFSEMAAALFTPSSAFYNSAALRAALLDAQSGVFSWFLSAQPQDEANWWYQAIGCGRPIAQVSLQLRASLSAAGVSNATALMDRSQWESFSSTGTNAADIALVHIGNGLLNGNRSMVAQAFAKIWSTVQYAGSAPPTSPEGPKSDGSFMQHGAQLYLGNYGASWTKDVLSNIAVAANTSFNASAASLAVVTHVVLDGCARAIHWPSAQWDVAVIGRQVTGPGSQAVVGRVGGPDTDLLDPGVLRASAAGPRAAELLALAAALEDPASVRMPARFSAFYAADYAVQTRPEYFASVRMISARTAGGECINGQGLQSLHAADGAQYIMATGYEFNDIAPTWNWEMLPGTTVQRGGAPLTCKTADGMGAGTMTGVMSRDNASGVAWMDFNNTRYGQNLRARKAYFFLEGVLINVGAAVEAPAGFRVTTTLDSRLLAGAVAVSRDGGASFATQPAGNATLPLSTPAAGAPRLLVAHSGMGFAELGAAGAAGAAVPAAAQLLNAPVTGNWSSVGASTGSITNKMFTLSLDHGVDTAGGAAYAYAIWPAVAAPAFVGGAWRAALARYAVVSNTHAVAAVFDSVNSTLYAIAWDGGAASRVTLPAALRAGFVETPFPAALIVTTYDNTTTGATVLSVSYVDPGALVTAAHDYKYYFTTGAAFAPCSWPNCPGATDAPKGYVGPPVLKWNCFANGTVLVESPPNQASMPGSMLFPPFNCALA